MLHSRVKIILEYVKAVEAGENTMWPFNEAVRAKNVKISPENSCFLMFPSLTFTQLREAPWQHLHNYKPVFDTVSSASSYLTIGALNLFFSLLCATTGEVPFNHEILREANALCHRLPVLSTIKFKTDFYDVSKMFCPFKMFLNP